MVVDVTNKEVIDLFQDGLYHHRNFKDLGGHRPSSIIKLKDMIASWADEEDKPQPSKEVQVKAIDLGTGDNSKTTVIGAGLDPKYEDTLVSFLRANRDTFAWKPADMPGVPRNLIEHSLNIDPKATPKRQNLHRFADDRWDAIKKKLAKLLAASFIREVFHPSGSPTPLRPQEEHERVEDVRRLHRPQQTLPQGPLLVAAD
jgi:hypothetical protein